MAIGDFVAPSSLTGLRSKWCVRAVNGAPGQRSNEAHGGAHLASCSQYFHASGMMMARRDVVVIVACCILLIFFSPSLLYYLPLLFFWLLFFYLSIIIILRITYYTVIQSHRFLVPSFIEFNCTLNQCHLASFT